jgi:cytochrome c6
MRRLPLVVAVVSLAVGAAGCGGGETVGAQPQNSPGGAKQTTTTTTTSNTGSGKPMGNATAGKQVFATAGCTGCHTLKDAGSNGTVGPNLDDAKPPDDLVVERVTNGKGAMPSFKGQLSSKQIQDVAAYVSSVAGT